MKIVCFLLGLIDI